MKSQQLILRHLIENNILEPSNTEEVLPIFSYDAASTVAVTIVASFTENGSLPELTSKFSIDWVEQVVAYCLSLPTLFQQSLINSMLIFRHWLSSPHFFKDDKTWNIYARRIFRYLSLIFDYQKDKFDLTIRVELIDMLLADFEFYQKTLKSRFDNETWDVLIRILIGASDFLISSDLTDEYISDSIRKPLRNKCFMLTFFTINNSLLTTKTIWALFFKFCSKWSNCEEFLNAWKTKVCEIFSDLLLSLYKNKKTKTTEELNSTGFHLHQFIHCINFDIIIKNQNQFNILCHLIEELDIVASNLTSDFDEHSKTSLYRPRFPASLFFELFGHWCFQPFSPSYQAEDDDNILKGCAIIVRELMKISDSWVFDQQWSKVLISTIVGNLNTSGNSQVMISIMNNSHQLFKQFISNELIDKFYAAIEQFANLDSPCISFWNCYATLLNIIAERKEIKDVVVQRFLEKSKFLKATFNVLSIVLRQRPKDFVTEVVKLADRAFDIKRPNKTDRSRSDALIELLSMLCLLIAAAPPFVKLENVGALLDKLLDCVCEYKKSAKFVQSFLVMISSLTRWSDSVFRPIFVTKLIDFLVDLKQENNEDILNVSRLILGRPVDRDLQTVDDSKRLASFMVGDSSIITIFGDDETDREESFVVHVREPRGFFIWRLEDVLDKGTLMKPTDADSLNNPPTVMVNLIDPLDNLNFKESKDFGKKISESKTIDKEYTSPSHHSQKSHISIYTEDQRFRLRHKAVDFVIQTQISNDVRKISDSVSEILGKFDSIDAVSRLEVPLFHCRSSGFTNEQTPLFRRFSSLLGPQNRRGVPEVKMGLLDILFSHEFSNSNKLISGESDVKSGSSLKEKEKNSPRNFIGILFNESSLQLNISHRLIPKCDLLFVVAPFDLSFYRVQCLCESPLFCCDVSTERMVSTENLSCAISMAIFQFVAISRPQIFFSKDEERAKFLREVKTEKVSALGMANGYALDAFRE